MSDLTSAPVETAKSPLPPAGALAGKIQARRGRWLSRHTATELVALFDAVVIMGTSVAAGSVYSQGVLGHWGQTETFFGAGLLAALLMIGSLRASGYYRFERFYGLWNQTHPILARWPVILLLLIALAFLTKTSADHSRGWILSWFVLGGAALAGSRIPVRAIFRHFASDGRALSRRVAVIGATPLADTFIGHIRDTAEPIQLAGVFDDPADKTGDTPPQVDGTIDALINRALAGEIDEIVIAIGGSREAAVTELVRRLSYLAVPVHICPDEISLRFQSRDHVELGGIKMIEANPRPLCGWPGIAKEVFDFLASAGLLLVLSPALLAIAIGVKLSSPGPIFFKQRRHGFNHGTFRIYKFRTMTCMEDDSAIVQAKKDDLRVTPFGGFLRRTSLDELPQLINVLLGEMSLVGPRPHALSHNDAYSRLIEDYACRHKVRPGITGWAQVNGFRGETASPELMTKRVEHDLHYIENWSPLLDLKILLMTLRAVLFPKNAH